MSTTTYEVTDGRKPVVWLNYRGNVSLPPTIVADLIDPRTPMGPTYDGESLFPVKVTYDPEADRSRVGFSYAAPPAKSEPEGT